MHDFISNYNTDVSDFLESRKSLKGKEREFYYLRYGDMMRLAKKTYGDDIDIEVLTSDIIDKNHELINDVPYFQCHEGNFGYVKTKVIIKNLPCGRMEQECILPIMDANFNSIPLDKITSADIDDTIQRCKVKNVAMATGLGLCLYRGKVKDTLEPITLTNEDVKEMKDNFFMWCYKQNPLKLDSENSRTVLGNKYVSWADCLVALKMLFPYATFSVETEKQQKISEDAERIDYIDIIPYKRRGNGEIVSSVKINIPLPQNDDSKKKEVKCVKGERRILDATRMKTVNLNTPIYNYKGREIKVDYGFAINSGIQRAFCKTLAENTGLYLNYYTKEQEEERIKQNEEIEKEEPTAQKEEREEIRDYLLLKSILKEYYNKDIIDIKDIAVRNKESEISIESVKRQLEDTLKLFASEKLDFRVVPREKFNTFTKEEKNSFKRLLNRLTNITQERTY